MIEFGPATGRAEEYAARIAAAFPGDSARLALTLDAIRAGAARVWWVTDDGREVGLFVTTINAARELEILAAVSSGARFSVAARVLPKLDAVARKSGAAGVVFDTFRPALVRMAARRGFRAVSMRMWRGVGDGVQ